MVSLSRFGYATACVLAVALAASFAARAGASSSGIGAVSTSGTAPAVTRSDSWLGTPTVPVAVTRARSFTVSGALSSNHDGQVTLNCYRRDAGVWELVRTVPATVTTSAGGAEFSGSVALDAAGTWVIRAETTSTPSPSSSPTSSAIRVSSRADAIIWNRDGVSTMPERMAYRSDARQLIVVTAKGLKSHVGRMTVYEYRSGDWVVLFSSACRLGRNGLIAGEKRRRGSYKTPTGIWRMPDYVFGQHAAKPKGTKLAYRHITKYSWWSAEKGSHYNTWFSTHRRHVDGEHLISYTNTYEYALSSGYNAKPNSSVYGRGTGIFLHVWLGKTTAGCVSVPRATMQRVFKTMDLSKKRVCVVGTLGNNDATCVDKY